MKEVDKEGQEMALLPKDLRRDSMACTLCATVDFRICKKIQAFGKCRQAYDNYRKISKCKKGIAEFLHH